MEETAKIVANILDRLFAIKDEALKAMANIDDATDAEFRTIIELRSLATELYDVMHQDELDEYEEDERTEDEP